MRAMPGLWRWCGLWRWRRNPLRRRSDLVEAWAGLATAVAVGVGAPLAGWATGQAVDGRLEHTVRLEHAARHQVAAVVVRTTSRPVPVTDTDAISALAAARTAVVRWTGPDGAPRTGTVFIAHRHAAGDLLPVWTDTAGRLVQRPMDEATARTNAVAAGIGTAGGIAALACAARQMLGWRIMRRRLADWEREWARVGQDWGRAGAGG